MFDNKILFSIIVTTYNDAKYIDKCLSEKISINKHP